MSLSEKANRLAEEVWNSTHKGIKLFIRMSRTCNIEDSMTEKCLAEMIASAFYELDKEKEADNDRKST